MDKVIKFGTDGWRAVIAEDSNKGRKQRDSPLSRRALAVLESLPRRSDGYVFGPVGDPRRAFKTAARIAMTEGMPKCSPVVSSPLDKLLFRRRISHPAISNCHSKYAVSKMR